MRLLWSVAAGRFALVTDAIAGAGLGDGDYALGERRPRRQRRRRPRDDGVLAGSTLTMIQAVRNLVELGVPLERAAEAASSVPPVSSGLRDLGRLALGRRADVVVLDDNLEIERVLVGGETRVAG